ncbi:nitrate- and nitrite sensing domain-containing protein [Streptomyces sp. NPDC020875]|uniref:sensor histidine kinase n=1 Tax=Streptomyces sp. NPDC020875 TaxID=3154898 RepID=UPI0033E0B8F5
MTTTPIDPKRRGKRGRRRAVLTVRSRLVLVAVVSVTALVALVAVNAVRDWSLQMSLRRDSATGELGGEASLPLFIGAQAERKATAVFLEDPSGANRQALVKARAATDEGIASFRHMSGTKLETDLRHKWSYVERIYGELDEVAAVRERVDGRRESRAGATGYYTRLLTSMVEFYQALSAMDAAELNTETRALVGLFWAVEGLAQEDMLLSAARAAGRMSAADRRAFASAYGAQHVMYERWVAPYLPPKDRALYDAVTSSRAWAVKKRVEEAVLAAPGGPGGVLEELPAEVGEWEAAYREVAGGITALNGSRTAGLLASGYQEADEVRSDVVLQVVSSLVAVLAIGTLIVGVVRSVARRVRQVRAAAEGTGQYLPQMVQRLRAGERLDPRAEFPDPRGRADEFSDLERALAVSGRMVLEIAAAQAGDRRGFASFVAMTTTRALNGVERQLSELARLEEHYGQDSEVLRALIGLDRTAVGTRRHLDNLLTLTGRRHEPYTEPMTLADAVLDAGAETSGPERIENRVHGEVWLSPRAVNGVVHVMGALLENALSFSRGRVGVGVSTAARGIAVEIEDRGTGMTPEAFERANRALTEPATFESMAAGRQGQLGLFVAGHLAARYGMRVRLRPSDYGGVTAVIFLPYGLTVPPPEPAPAPSRPVTAVDDAPAGSRGPGTLGGLPQRAPGTSRPTAPVAAAGPEVASRAGQVTDPSAPPLPRREGGRHLAPQLARTPAAPAARPQLEDDHRSPESVGASWGAFQRGSRTAEINGTSNDKGVN